MLVEPATVSPSRDALREHPENIKPAAAADSNAFCAKERSPPVIFTES